MTQKGCDSVHVEGDTEAVIVMLYGTAAVVWNDPFLDAYVQLLKGRIDWLSACRNGFRLAFLWKGLNMMSHTSAIVGYIRWVAGLGNLLTTLAFRPFQG